MISCQLVNRKVACKNMDDKSIYAFELSSCLLLQLNDGRRVDEIDRLDAGV